MSRKKQTKPVYKIKDEIRELTKNINDRISTMETVPPIIEKEIRGIQILTTGSKKNNLKLRYWFKGRNKSSLEQQLRELERFDRIDNYSKEALKRNEDIAKSAYDSYIEKANEISSLGYRKSMSFEDFKKMRDMFGDTTRELIEQFGYENVKGVFDEVKDTELVNEMGYYMQHINENWSEYSSEVQTPDNSIAVLRSILHI